MTDYAESLLKKVAAGELDFTAALAEAARFSGGGDLGVARLDFEREARCGFPEFIYGAGKSTAQLLPIVEAMLARCGRVLVTRLDEPRGRMLAERFPAGFHDDAAGIFLVAGTPPELPGRTVVLCAGTSDLPVALEAKYTLEFCGGAVDLIADVGVAGLSRLFAVLDRLLDADAAIVVAGMEGALPSVVGGLLPCPVIAVPTGVGYGAALGGFAALAGMLNSCAAGVTVVNIDNGFGAACAAVRILNRLKKFDETDKV